MPAPNAAEARNSGVGAGNAAEGPAGYRKGGEVGNLGEKGLAEPPKPEMKVPPPGQIAGDVEGYTAPTISVIVPPLESLPVRPSDSQFYMPERGYLETRPLPPVDVTETDEELIARNVEEALKRINLGAEVRPQEGVQIPLPSGVVTFKASESFQFDRRNRILTFTGNAEIVVGDMLIMGDMIEVNDMAATVYGKGYVGLIKGDEALYCDEAYFNYDTQTLELFNVEGNTTGARIRGNVYYFAQRATGGFDKLLMEKVEVTTCDPMCGETKEAHLSAHKAVFKRYSSIQLHDVYIYIREHKVAYVPLLAVPTPRPRRVIEADQESDVSSTYGYSRAEGWFAKFAYTYSTVYHDEINDPFIGKLNVDLTEKLGPGVRVRQDFLVPSLGVTSITAFYQREWDFNRSKLPDGSLGSARENYEFSLSQELNIAKSMQGSFKIQRRNDIVPATTVNGRDTRTNSWNNTLALNYNQGKTQAGLNLSQRVSLSGGQQGTGGQALLNRTANLTGAFNFRRDFNKELKFTLDQQFSADKGSNTATGVPADQEGTFSMKLDFTPQEDSAMKGWSVRANYLEQGIDYDRDRNTTDSSRQIRKELPSVVITAPRDLMGEGAYFNQYEVSFDNLVTGNRRRPESSFRNKWRFGGSDTIKFSRSSRMDLRSGFEQYYYDDGNRQYVINQNVNYTYDSFDWWKLDASWAILYQQGVKLPPVQGDRQTYRQTFSYGATMTNRRSWRWRLQSGFDLRQLPNHHFPAPNPLSSTFNWDPNDTFSFSHSTSYEMLTKKWSVSNITGVWRSPHEREDGFYNWWLGLRLALDTDYMYLWRASRLDLQWYKRYPRGWSSEVLGSWRKGDAAGTPDGLWDLSDEFIRKIAVRKVNCCTTVEAGWRTGINEFYLNFYLNALPQYPFDLDTRRLGDNEMSINPMFPAQTVMYDIQTDVFGFSTAQFGRF